MKFPILRYLTSKYRVYGHSENVYIDCPICGGHRKLSVHLELGLFHCFRCKEGGHGAGIWNGATNLPGFIALIERCSLQEAKTRIASWSGIEEPPAVSHRQEEIRWPSEREALPLKLADKSHPARAMLRNRGVEHLIDQARVGTFGKYAGRVLLSAHFLDQWIGFEAKTFCGQNPKSLFPPGMRTGSYVYTTRAWDRDTPVAYITESIIDAETIGVNAIGIFGSNFTDGHLSRLLTLNRAYGVRQIVWCLDADASLRQIRFLMRKCSGLFQNYIADIPDGHDPNSLGRERMHELIRTSIPIMSDIDAISVAASKALK
ncbi:MAG: hypothetical protein QXG97_00720 [Nitrososphaerota archaeon]